MRIVALLLFLALTLVQSKSFAAPGPNISKPKSTSNANRAVRTNAEKNINTAKRGRLKLAQDAMVISQSQHRIAKKNLTDADLAHDSAEAANIAANTRYQQVQFDPNASQSAKDRAKAEVDRTRTARTAARDRFRRAQTIEAEISGQVQQNTAVSMALRRGQWNLVDRNQATLTPMPAPPLPGAGG